MTPARVTLLTDFGMRDGYVAVMKGVIATIAPGVIIDDAAHDIDAGDISSAAFALRRYWKLYPPETVHVVVVDPGVGTARRALAASCDGRFLVGPDNGVLSLALAATGNAEVVAIDSSRMPSVSSTFHGRDVFAPIAARLALGDPLTRLGVSCTDWQRIDVVMPRRGDRVVQGEVVYVDRFGNLITNIAAPSVPGEAQVRVDGRIVMDMTRTYADVAVGEVTAVINSESVLEITVRDGSAFEKLALGRGTVVEVVYQ